MSHLFFSISKVTWGVNYKGGVCVLLWSHCRKLDLILQCPFFFLPSLSVSCWVSGSWCFSLSTGLQEKAEKVCHERVNQSSYRKIKGERETYPVHLSCAHTRDGGRQANQSEGGWCRSPWWGTSMLKEHLKTEGSVVWIKGGLGKKKCE